jgi:hypothetical protein
LWGSMARAAVWAALALSAGRTTDITACSLSPGAMVDAVRGRASINTLYTELAK